MTAPTASEHGRPGPRPAARSAAAGHAYPCPVRCRASETVTVDQPARLHRRRIVEHRTQPLHRTGAATASEPLRDDLIPHPADRHIAIAVHEALGQLPATDVARLLRPGEQRVGRPTLPEPPHRHIPRMGIPQAFPRPQTSLLGLRLRRKRAETTENPGHADVLPGGRVIDLRPPAARGEPCDAHAALLRSDAQPIACEALKRRVRRPHVTDGIPSATIRSTVAKLTPMSPASSPARHKALTPERPPRRTGWVMGKIASAHPLIDPETPKPATNFSEHPATGHKRPPPRAHAQPAQHPDSPRATPPALTLPQSHCTSNDPDTDQMHLPSGGAQNAVPGRPAASGLAPNVPV